MEKNQQEIRPHPKRKSKKKQKVDKPQSDFQSSSCKQRNWIEFDKNYSYQNCGINIKKPKHQLDKKVLRQDRNFSTRLPYANTTIREKYFSMVNTKYYSTEDMTNKKQS